MSPVKVFESRKKVCGLGSQRLWMWCWRRGRGGVEQSCRGESRFWGASLSGGGGFGIRRLGGGRLIGVRFGCLSFGEGGWKEG